MKLGTVLCLLVCQVSSLYEYDYGSEQDDSRSELAQDFASNSDQYYMRPLQSFSRDNLARHWGMGAGGPYEYNRNFWKGSRGIGWGFGPNPWMNMFLLGKQMKYTYSKDSPRAYKGPLTNGVLRRRQEREFARRLRHDMKTGKYDHDIHKYGESPWEKKSIVDVNDDDYDGWYPDWY